MLSGSDLHKSEERGEVSTVEQSSLLQEFFCLRHGLRLDQHDLNWRQSSTTPYDTPLAPVGVLQSQLAGHAIFNQSSSKGRLTMPPDGEQSFHDTAVRKEKRRIIHTSPFLRCLQTSLALASVLAKESGQKPVLRVDCFLGEWLTPGYFQDITTPPSMPEMAKGALHYLSQIERLKPNSSHLRVAPILPVHDRATHSSPLSIAPGLYIDAEDVEIDWTWQPTLFGSGGEYGEEWPEMHSRFRESLSALVQYYSTGSAGHENASVVMVTHGAGCNAMIGAVTGKPVMTDIGLASLSHAVLMRSPEYKDDHLVDRHKETLKQQYRLLMSGSTDHLIPLMSPKSASRRQWSGEEHHAKNSVGRSGSWHKAIGRSASTQFPKQTGLWSSATNSPPDSPEAARFDASSSSKPGRVDSLPPMDWKQSFAQRGRHRSSTTTT